MIVWRFKPVIARASCVFDIAGLSEIGEIFMEVSIMPRGRPD